MSKVVAKKKRSHGRSSKARTATKTEDRYVPRTEPIRFSELVGDEKEYFRWLHGLLDDAFARAKSRKWTWHQLADEAGLLRATVDRLGDRLTLFPRIYTVRKLLKAVDMTLEAYEPKVVKMRKAG